MDIYIWEVHASEYRNCSALLFFTTYYTKSGGTKALGNHFCSNSTVLGLTSAMSECHTDRTSEQKFIKWTQVSS